MKYVLYTMQYGTKFYYRFVTSNMEIVYSCDKEKAQKFDFADAKWNMNNLLYNTEMEEAQI